MRQVSFKIYTVLAAVLLLCSCSVDELVPSVEGNMVQVTGRVMPFTENGAVTKSTKNSYETVVKNMALFVFDSDGDKVDYNLVPSGQPLFIIDRNNTPYSDHDQTKMAACKLYILANIPDADQIMLEGITTESGFLAADCTIGNVIRTSGIDSYGGLPMWGAITKTESGGDIDLRSTSTALVGSVLTIPLTCMMSKLTFNISVDPVQKSDYVQRFELKSWTVENAPENVRVAQPAGTAESVHADGPFLEAVTFGQVDNGVNPVMQGASTKMSFCCYVPEHRVLPSNSSVDYPAGIDDVFRQNYKPRWLTDSDKPLKITLNGVYTDHRNLEKQVTYTIYPGADNWKDFFVERNHEYIHNISIQGISNSIHGEELSVSLDCRVDVQQNDFRFELERETLLDSHWEIRPIRITLDPVAHPNADHIEVEIMNASSASWIRMEMPTTSQISSGKGTTYCNVADGALASGKRRFFTSDLVTNTLSGNTLVSFQASDTGNSGTSYEHTIWVYIDENTALPSSPGSSVRTADLQCRYYEKNQTAPSVTEDYYFMQKSLHNITYNSHTYGIEFYEEYLYNFDASEQYGSTTDGMAWGLNNTQLSNKYKSYNYSASGLIGGYIASVINSAMQKVAIKYDFYLTRDGVKEGLTVRDYSGYEFTQEIASNTNSGIGVLATNAQPQSAVEYCFNKNKRKSDGTVDVDNMHWYLPAIDEIEDICKGGYSDFEVFQDKYYWSSQPAYKIGKMDYVAKVTSEEVVFDYYFDDIGQAEDPNNIIGRARATKINDRFENVKSESHGQAGLLMAAGRGENITDGPDYYPCYQGHNVSQNKTYQECGIYVIFVGYQTYTTTQANITWSSSTHYYDEGNQPRTAVNRIRCAYKAD